MLLKAVGRFLCVTASTNFLFFFLIFFFFFFVLALNTANNTTEWPEHWRAVSKSSCESAGRFFCDNGLCIDKVLHCDGKRDCSDDEQNCRKFFALTTKLSHCRSFALLLQMTVFLCLPFWLCFIYHVQIIFSLSIVSLIPANSPLATLESCTSLGKFYCHTSHECIDAAMQCDGVQQCLDRSDEDFCCKREKKPNFDETWHP